MNTVPPPDRHSQHLREYTTAGLALAIVIGFFVLMVVAVEYTDSAEEFGRIKDLITLATPIVGVVVGYYFGKSTGEARAEGAEQTAQVASNAAQQAIQGQQAAAQQAQNATEVAAELTAAAEEVLANSAPPEGAVGDFAPSPDHVRLEMAVRRARRRAPFL